MIENITNNYTSLKERYDEKNRLIQEGNIDFGSKEYKELSRELKEIEKLLNMYKELEKVNDELRQTEDILESGSEQELRELAAEEREILLKKKNNLVEDITIASLPQHPYHGKDIIMEIRAGTGGDEAALFAADLFRMYSRFAENRKWKIEILSSNPTGVGGYKEIVFSVSGENVFDTLHFEMGGHRVQRIPVTESGGRIHTSAVTVAVLPEMEETEVDIDENELKIDVYRSSGPGGQSVNTTDSAVRITHLPTGIVVTCQDEKSQHKNKAKALRVLRARIQEIMEKEKQAEYAQQRRTQIGSGDRSEKIRTYNFPQNRVTDHRIKVNYHNLTEILNGYLDELVNDLTIREREALLNSK